MAITIGRDAFVTVAEADAYLASIPDRESWAPLELPVKERYIRLATRLMDDMFDWEGWPVEYSQPLAFPRDGLHSRHGVDFEDDRYAWPYGFYEPIGIPDKVKNATSELAYLLRETDFTEDEVVADLDLRGSGATTFGGGAFRRGLPSSVVDMIPNEWYEHVKGTGSVTSVKLMRA